METNKTTRELALKWWNSLSPYDEQHSLREKYFGNERLTSSLTGREIEQIWLKETVHIDFSDIESAYRMQVKPNQKECKYCYSTTNSCNDIEAESCQNREILFNQYNAKINQKQFKQFDESLFKAYINKFSDEDKVKALEIIYDELNGKFNSNGKLFIKGYLTFIKQ